jgi:hypothetical protein
MGRDDGVDGVRRKDEAGQGRGRGEGVGSEAMDGPKETREGGKEKAHCCYALVACGSKTFLECLHA